MIYTPKIAQEILIKIHSKGWNAYCSTRSREIGRDRIIRECLADKLQMNERYVLMPVSEDPRNPEQVMRALEHYAICNNREMPSIQVNGERFPWTGFRLHKDFVKVNTIEGHFISYPRFIEALETANSGNITKPI